MKIIKIGMLLMLAFTAEARAGFDESYKALRAGDFATAQSEARKAADAGDPRGFQLLGVIYSSGYGVPVDQATAYQWFEKAADGGVAGAFTILARDNFFAMGTPKNIKKAMEYARKSAALGNPEGMLYVYVAARMDGLDYTGTDGKPDIQKYNVLANRPVSERQLDIESQDDLYKSVALGYSQAIGSLALNFATTLGDGNRKKMLELISKMNTPKSPMLENYGKIARAMDDLGESYTTPKLFYDSQASQAGSAMLRACGLQAKKEVNASDRPKLISIAIQKPLSNAQYLPSNVPGFEHSNLIAGTWQETWTYSVCGKTVAVPVDFVADGFGGARMTSVVSGKDIPGLGVQTEK